MANAEINLYAIVLNGKRVHSVHFDAAVAGHWRDCKEADGYDAQIVMLDDDAIESFERTLEAAKIARDKAN